MLKATELRIGNYILSWEDGNQGNPAKVTAANLETLSKVGPHQEYMALKPVPLTTELLEKCGFEYLPTAVRRESEARKCWGIQVANNTYLECELVEGVDASKNENSEWYEWGLANEFAHPRAEFWNQPNYLHQLQNLYFALTGEELSVNL